MIVYAPEVKPLALRVLRAHMDPHNPHHKHVFDAAIRRSMVFIDEEQIKPFLAELSPFTHLDHLPDLAIDSARTIYLGLCDILNYNPHPPWLDKDFTELG